MIGFITYWFCNIFKAMATKALNKSPHQPELPVNKKPPTQLIDTKIEHQIITGVIDIKQSPAHIEPLPKPHSQLELRDKIHSLNQGLAQLHRNISLQKEQERAREEQKRREAMLLIERLRRDKEQHRNRLKVNELNLRYKERLFSEDVLELMRDRRQSLAEQKRRDIELRIYENMNRKQRRQEQLANAQLEYRSRVKKLDENRRHQSNKLLPAINKLSATPQFGVNLEQIQAQNKPLTKQRHKRSFSKPNLQKMQYQDVVGLFVSRAKQQMIEHNGENLSINAKSRVFSNPPAFQTNKKLRQLNVQGVSRKVSALQTPQHQIDGPAGSMTHEYLSFKFNGPYTSKTEQSSQKELALQGSQAHIFKNQKIVEIEARRNRVFQLLGCDRIGKEKAIQMLGPIERQLDKMLPEEMEKRLRQKLQVFSKLKVQSQQSYREQQAENEFLNA